MFILYNPASRDVGKTITHFDNRLNVPVLYYIVNLTYLGIDLFLDQTRHCSIMTNTMFLTVLVIIVPIIKNSQCW